MDEINETYFRLREVDRYLNDWISRSLLEPEISTQYAAEYKELKWMLLNKLAQECETEMSKQKK